MFEYLGLERLFPLGLGFCSRIVWGTIETFDICKHISGILIHTFCLCVLFCHQVKLETCLSLRRQFN